MSKTVLEYFTREGMTPQEEYNHGLSLLMQATTSRNLIKTYNNRGFSSTGLENLKYDLKKAYGIKDSDIRKFKAENVDIVPILEERNLEGFMEENKDKVSEILSEMDEEAKKGMKLYGKYTFLRSKDCPEKLAILVNQAITAFEDYKAGHKELFDKVAALADPVLDENEIFQIANQVLDDFELNREIHAELQHYADTGEILGEHKIFADLKMERKIAGLSAAELSKNFNNLKTYISKSNTSLKKAVTDEEKQEWKEHIANLEKEKSMVKKYLDEKK